MTDDFKRREIEAARKALNVQTRAMKARRGLNAAALNIDQRILFQAAAHATCFKAYAAGISHDELSRRLRDDKTAPAGTLLISDARVQVLEQSLGLRRTTESERRIINKTLAGLYNAVADLPVDSFLEIFIPFLKRSAPQIGLPVDVAVTRVENLDAVMRFAGPAKRYVPEDQFGL